MRLRTSASTVCVLASMILVGTARISAADTITLMWDANSEPQIAGYLVHVGTQSGAYTQHLDVGNATTYSFTSAVAGEQYCFAVSAYFTGPVEGPNSAEVCGYSNRPPTLVNPGARSSTLSQPTTLQLQGADPDGQAVSYSATGLPAGLTLQSSTGFISGTPTTAGSFNVTAIVSDGMLTTSQSFTWTIGAPDAIAPALTITVPTSAATYTSTVSTMTVGGIASDNIAVTQVTWLNDRGGSGAATGTTAWSVAAVALQSGTNVITVTGRDAAGNTASDVITVTYTANTNVAPTLAPVPNQTSTVGQPVSLQLVGSDANNDRVAYYASGLPAGLALNSSTGVIAGTPTTAGTYAVTVGVGDAQLYNTTTFTWTITAATAPDTSAPVVTITGPTTAATYATTATTLTLSGTASDDRGVTQVTWVSNRGGSGTASGTTAWSVAAIALAGGSNVITVTARDAAGNTSTDILTVAVNTAPVLAVIANQSSQVGVAAVLQVTATDADGNVLTFSATGLPPGMTLTASTGVVSGTPVQAGTYNVTATVTDGTQSASRTFSWTVVTGDVTAPSVTITGPTSASTMTTASSSLALSGVASDVVGVTQVTWSNDRGGSGVAAGTTSWTIGGIVLQIGVNVVTVTARDAAGNTATDVVTVTYTAQQTNVAPTLAAVATQTSTVGQAVSLQLVGADANGDRLTYAASGLPAGLTLNASTGHISGTPTKGRTHNVTVSVTDGVFSVVREFKWVVR